MRLFILAVSLTAALALHCPEQCDCGTGDELDYFCRVKDANVTFNGRNNEYVNVKCTGTNFTCSDLPVFNFANDLTLPSLGLMSCSPSILRCIKQVLQATSVSSIVITNGTEPLVGEDMLELGDVKDFMIKNGAEHTVPVSALNTLPSLRNIRIFGSNLTLHSDAFTEFPPIEFLELSADKITNVPEDAFSGLSKLEILNVWGNNISEIGVNSLRGLDSLKSLTMNTNHLTHIPAGAFAHVPKLTNIILYGNQLAELPAGLLHNLPQLEKITIHYNFVELKLHSKALSNLTSLKNLKLLSSKITTLPEDLLTGNEALKSLSLTDNKITSLPANFFKDLKSLEILNLSLNKIESLTTGTFASLKQLKELNLNRNYLEVLPDFLFSGLRNLNYVSMDHNNLTTISQSAFQGAVGLQTISLKSNKLTLKSKEYEYLNFEEYSPFNILVELKQLYLNGNRINTMFADWRMVLIHLEELNLSWNNFTFLETTDFQFLSENIVVDLQNNKINSLILNHASQSPSDVPPSKSSILLDGNPLTCDCGLYNLAMRLHGATPLTIEPKFILGNARCASPPNLQGNLFKRVSPNDLNCDLEAEYCYSSCLTCQMRPALSDLDYDCITIPPTLPNPENFGLKSISLKLDNAPKYIGNLSLQLLNLTKTGLKEIPFNPSDTVKVIDFSNNKLTKIPIDFLESNTTLYLSGNPFECQCWYSEEISALQKSDLVPDLDRVTCDGGDKLIKVDVVALCSTWRAAAVASGTFIVLVLIVALSVVTVYRYSHEILIYITSKGFFPCCFTDDPDDANKAYDIFVSYAHKDRKFFLELLPKLENDFGQKTCVHYRDWSVGDLIPDQINKSVESSRRTVILLSSNFLDSSYANMEFRTAHNLALKEGKTRVILILIEDVTKHEKLSEELRAYIKTNTYLTWDDPQFWQRLQHALPMRNNKKFVWPDVFKQMGGKAVKSGLDVHLNSEGQLVNVAIKEKV